MDNYRIRVAVLRGGPSSEYTVSLKSGAEVMRHLAQSGTHDAHDIFIDRSGVWHYQGVAREPERLLRHFDVVFNALHGEYGEDGKVQRLLNNLGMHYTGSKALASSIAMNKVMTKDRVARAGVKVPMHAVVLRGDDIHKKALELWRTFPQPSIVKPAGLGSSVGITFVHSFPMMEKALRVALAGSPAVVVEEYIRGREATVGVVDSFRGSDVYPFPPVEIRLPPTSEIFDYDAKCGGKTQELCPGDFSEEESRQLKDLAVLAHKELGLRHYSRSDFIVSPKRGIYFLETNTLPGLTSESLLPKAINADGISLGDFLRHVIELARSGR
jgi:D-alanine-D-alanine ligase